MLANECKGCKKELEKCTCTDYERLRTQNIERNEAFLRSHGFPTFRSSPTKKPQPKTRQLYIRKDPTFQGLEGARCSKRRLDDTITSSHPKISNMATCSVASVHCDKCGKNVLNPKKKEAEALLKLHRRKISACVPSIVIEHSFDAGLVEIFSEPESEPESVDSEVVDEDEFVDNQYDHAEYDHADDQDDVYVTNSIEDVETFPPNITFNSLHLSRCKDVLASHNPRKLVPSKLIYQQQGRMMRHLKMNASDAGGMSFRSLKQAGSKLDVDWHDLTKIYEFGLSANLSRDHGDKLLHMMQDIFDRHECPIQLRKTWRSLQYAVDKQKVKNLYELKEHRYKLPEEYFGIVNKATGKTLKPFKTSSVHIFSLLADILLHLQSPDDLVTRFSNPGDIPEADRILSDFSTGSLFKRISEYYNTFKPIDGLRVVPILLGVWLDDTTTSSSRVSSECPVYLTIVNIKGEKEFYLLGFAPRCCPYSDSNLKRLLRDHDIDRVTYQKYIINMMKTQVVRDFLYDTIGPAVNFGRNCFKVQLGNGPQAEKACGVCHLVILGGDGKELDGLCGCNHAKERMCRLCLENRPSLFLPLPRIPIQLRFDSVHEQVSYDLLQVDKRRIVGQGRTQSGKRKLYRYTDGDNEIIGQAKRLCITAAENKIYRLFYGLNCLGFAGLHQSVWPDVLHVVQKGIIEKTLSDVLLIVLAVQSKLYPLKYSSAMGKLDQRVMQMSPIHSFDWMRWTTFSDGLSSLLKAESTTSRKADHTTGLLSGGIFSWKLLSALFQAMICIGSDGTILPTGKRLQDFGFIDTRYDCIQDISDVVLSACASVVEMYAGLHCTKCTYRDERTIEYLIHNAGFHHLRLAMLKKVLPQCRIKKPSGPPIKWSKKDCPLISWTSAVGGNKFHMLMFHLAKAKSVVGADLSIVDTQKSEGCHKIFVKEPYAGTSKRGYGVRHELMMKSLRKHAVKRMNSRTNDTSSASDAAAKSDSRNGTRSFGAHGHIQSVELTCKKITNQEGYVWKRLISATSLYLHPLVHLDRVTEAISDLTDPFIPTVASPTGKLELINVYLMESVQCHETNGDQWKIQCNPCIKVSGSMNTNTEKEDHSSRQNFSSVVYKIEESEFYGRIMGIVLVCWKGDVDQEDDEQADYRFIIGRMEKLSAKSNRKTYLPYDVFAHAHKRSRSYQIDYVPWENIVRPIEFIRVHDSDVCSSGLEETKESFFSKTVGQPLFYLFDPLRFTYPKPAAVDIQYYTTMPADNTAIRPNDAYGPVFLPQSNLEEFVETLGLGRPKLRKSETNPQIPVEADDNMDEIWDNGVDTDARISIDFFEWVTS